MQTKFGKEISSKICQYFKQTKRMSCNKLQKVSEIKMRENKTQDKFVFTVNVELYLIFGLIFAYLH